MTDIPAPAWLPPESGPAPSKKPFFGRLAAGIAGHPYLALAAIIVLTLLVVGIYAYYHGIFFLGPYAPPSGASRASGARGKKKDRAAAAAGDEAQGDPETERLIDSINQH